MSTDRALYSKAVIRTAVKFDVRFSVTARQDKRIRTAIGAIGGAARQPIPYWLSTPQVSGADVAETPFTVFASDKRHARTRLAGSCRMSAETVKRRVEGFIRRAATNTDGPGMYGVYVGNDRVVIKLPWGRQMVAVASDMSLTPVLVAHGMYDWPFWNFVNRTLRRGDRAVDVGANIGLFTLAMAYSVGDEGQVTAYEPDPDLAQIVRTTWSRTGWAGA